MTDDNSSICVAMVVAASVLCSTVSFYAGKARVHYDVKTFDAVKIDEVMYVCKKENLE